jgi:hypothetical protein
MTIQEFADRYRVRVRRDSCGDDIIPGKQFAKDMPKREEYRSHIYDNGDGRFGVCLVYSTSVRNTTVKPRLTACGFTIGQVGHSECTALFDPANEQQARLAMAECGTRKPYTCSDTVRETRRTRMAALQARNIPPLTVLWAA